MSLSVDLTEGFRLVTGKRRKNRRKNTWNFNSAHLNHLNNVVDEEAVLRRFSDIRSELKLSEYFKNALATVQEAVRLTKIERLEKLICLGIGTLTNCPAALYQLAFILELNAQLNIEISEFYDPIFSRCDKSILKKLNCLLIQKNLEGKHSINHRGTLLYLPHCPKQLTNNFLWKNWDKSLLAKTVLICNSFDSIKRNSFDKHLEQDAEYLIRIIDFTDEFPLQNSFRVFDYFNDTSVHIFREPKLAQLPTSFWTNHNDPKYKESDTELITKELASKLNLLTIT